MSKKMPNLADEIREGVREVFKDMDLREVRGNYWLTAKKFLTREQRHDRKKKFLNAEEAQWWMEKTFFPDQIAEHRAYKCDLCPFWHLTTQKRFYK